MGNDFPARLSLVLKALSISRGQLAALVGVDKSLIGRWCSGTVKPSAHNLARLTRCLAERHTGFSLLDWERPVAELATGLGVAAPAPSASVPGLADWLPASLLAEAGAMGRIHGAGYEGLWRTTRPSSEVPGQFIHDYLLLQLTDAGLLQLRLGVMDIRFTGWSLPLQNKLFSICTDTTTGTFCFAIMNGVMSQRAEIVDGLIMTCMRDPSGTPIASKCLLNRIADPSGDAAADIAEFERRCAEYPLSTADAVPEHIRDHIWTDTGPTALADGGDTLLMLGLARSMARGASYEDQRGAK